MRLTDSAWQEMRIHAIHEAPREALGFVARDLDNGEMETYRLHNVAAEATIHFQADRIELQQRFCAAIDKGQEIVAIYHSHPVASASLSLRDIKLAWPGVVQIVIGLGKGIEARSFVIDRGMVSEEELIIV